MSRRYTEAEFRSILAKAVEDHPSGSVEVVSGLSLEEIKEIGAEVGIDPESLERAARSVESSIDLRSRLAGAPTTCSVERRVTGELASVQASDILSVIRHEMGTTGDLSEQQSFLEWRSSGELGHRVITLSTNEGTTTVRGLADLSQAAVITHLPAGLFGIMGSAIGFLVAANSGNELGMVMFAALIPTVLLGARKLFARLSRGEGRKLERAVEELALLVGDSE
ncbi:MAG: hypothetical protein P8170_21130 [Gemmatimonadota bacterium]